MQNPVNDFLTSSSSVKVCVCANEENLRGVGKVLEGRRFQGVQTGRRGYTATQRAKGR